MKGKDADDASFVMRQISEKALKMMKSHLRELLEGRRDKGVLREDRDGTRRRERPQPPHILLGVARDEPRGHLPKSRPRFIATWPTFRAVKGSVEY